MKNIFPVPTQDSIIKLVNKENRRNDSMLNSESIFILTVAVASFLAQLLSLFLGDTFNDYNIKISKDFHYNRKPINSSTQT